MVNKKGISAIVATVLILLLTVAGVTILWMQVAPIIRNDFETVDADAMVWVSSSNGYTVYDADKNLLSIKMSRGADEATMDGVDVIIFFSEGTSHLVVEAPKPNQDKVYVFNLTKTEHSNPISASLAAIFLVGDAQEYAPATSHVNIPTGTISKIPTTLYELSNN